jgi:pyrroloquinoline-quinone synthase
MTDDGPVLSPGAFVELLRHEGRIRYHDTHPFHVRMHEGGLSPLQLRQWVANRYYYQTRIPVKDALIVAKSEDAAFRRKWVERIVEQDGASIGKGGLALWLRLAEAVGLERHAVVTHAHVLPRVRAACDAYVEFVRERPLVEAVAASLTECFAPDLMRARLAAWERHYAWVDSEALGYFRSRVPAARRDGEFALVFVVAQATTSRVQQRCVRALIRKTEILNEILDAISAAYPDAEPAGGIAVRRSA